MNRYRITKILALILALAIGGGVSYYFFSARQHQQAAVNIIEFDYDRDAPEALEFFKTDTYWLLTNPNYPAEYALKTRSPNEYEPQYFGKMKIKVLRDPEKNKMIGFITYYMKGVLEGTILFLAVKDEYRGKGYAAQLVHYAVNDLKKMGAHIATLLTRTDNVRAQSVYRKTNFTETSRGDGYVYYAKMI